MCDNKLAIDIAFNPVQHDKQSIGTDIRFRKEKLDKGLITTTYVPFRHQLADVLAKSDNDRYPLTKLRAIVDNYHHYYSLCNYIFKTACKVVI